MEQSDVVRHHKAISRLVPTCAIEGQHSERPRTHLRADFLQMQVHRMNIGTR
jgi:hypothetical protein